MTTWTVGDVRVTKVLELEPRWPWSVLLPEAEEVYEKVDWLQPDFVDDKGRMKLSIHALVVESQGRTMIVDTCVGNGKSRPTTPPFHERDGEFLADLARVGVAAEEVDVVICTHLHVDHVGWNTRLVDGAWVPTFPNARYLFVRREYEHWRDTPQEYGPVFEDSIAPIVDAGLADLVEPDHRVNDEVWLEPTAGHTPGHCSVRIASRGEEAVITGDMMHHPVQCAEPEWCSSFDTDQKQGLETRRSFLERYGDSDVRIIGTHFATPTLGHIAREGRGWLFRV